MSKIFNISTVIFTLVLGAGILGAGISGAGVFSVGFAQAQTLKASSEYRVRVHGFPIAKINFSTEINGDDYTIVGKIKSSALADIVGKTRGDTKVIGKISPNRLQARSYTINYTTGKKSRAFDVEYDLNGKVVKAQIVPPRNPLPSDWVGVKENDLAAVVDPVSSLIFPLNSPVCSRTVSIFDGESLVDLKLSHKGHRRFKTKGFKGKVVACKVKFSPKGGYRSNHRSVKYLQNSDSMEVWFGKSDTLKAYVPVLAKIPTKIGIVHVRATRL
jgi:hypothetical protein